MGERNSAVRRHHPLAFILFQGIIATLPFAERRIVKGRIRQIEGAEVLENGLSKSPLAETAGVAQQFLSLSNLVVARPGLDWTSPAYHRK